MKQDVTQELLSEITVHMKYAKYDKDKGRRETFSEIVARNKEMHIKKFPELKDEIERVYKLVDDKKILPSMRSMQFAGRPIELNPSRVFNCAYLPIDDWRAFHEVMFLLLGGTGVGYSVQYHHVEQLPEINKPNPKRTRRYLIGDSIEGWSDAIKALMKSYFFGGSSLRFDFGDVRPKGAELITSGGKAPGPAPLRECLVKIDNLLMQKQTGDKLTPLEVHDIICYIADAVLAGGIRRAALISLFSMDDEEMLSCKTGKWYELEPQRGRANNSAVMVRSRVKKKDFFNFWEKVELNHTGEPGLYLSHDKDWGTNPCCEIALRPFQFCNLTEVNASNVESQEDLNERVRAAAFIGTLQASYTDFHYLRPIWQRTTEKDALLGVSMTGIASMEVFSYDLEEAAQEVKKENELVAELIGINPAARTTCVKPAGTTSLVLGTSSGIHAWHNDYYLRRLGMGKNEAIYTYLSINHPELLEDDYFNPTERAFVVVPQKAPDGSVTRQESALDLLNRVARVSKDWVSAGHRTGFNTHNVSATITVKDDEWAEVGEWMWDNRNIYNGLAVLPFDGGTYVQTPFEDIDKKEFDERVTSLHKIDLSNVFETQDNTDLSGELACAGGACEIV